MFRHCTNIDYSKILVKDENLWLTQAKMAELFEVKKAAISKHLKNIFLDGELQEQSVVSILETTAADSKRYKTNFYNLDAIIAVGYRVNSRKATQFRIWATNMEQNDMLYINGKKRIDDDTLFALTLFIAESEADKMEMFRQIIISILNRNLQHGV